MPKIVDILTLHAADPRDVIHEVVQALVEGQLVGLPTETFYAVAAYSAHPSAGARLVEALRIVDIRGTVLAVKGASEVPDYLPDLSPLGHKLLRRFWPGPVTLLVETRGAQAGLSKALPEATRQALIDEGRAALRAPTSEVVGAVLRLLPAPLLISGETTARGRGFSTAEELASASDNRLALIVDGGRCKYGEPTSVVHLAADRWELKREGVVTRRTLNRLAGIIYLFVCTGNTCRSPMAEGLFRKLLAERLRCSEDDLVDRGYVVASAGVSAGSGSPASPEAVDVLQSRGVDLRSHESQPVTPHLLSQADRIFTMTRSHYEVLVQEHPETADRVRLLSPDGSDVTDPIGSNLEEYRRCADQIEHSLLPILSEIPVT